jgi:hypothetical protein
MEKVIRILVKRRLAGRSPIVRDSSACESVEPRRAADPGVDRPAVSVRWKRNL